MIKSFEQFINENYNEIPTLSYGEVYGTPFFNEISESLMYNINRGINEGRIVLNTNIIEEGFFDTIGDLVGKLGKKAADKADKYMDNAIDLEDKLLKTVTTADNEKDIDKLIDKNLRKEEFFRIIEGLCDDAIALCTKLADKEQKMYDTFDEKMDAANEAVENFKKKLVDAFNSVVEKAKNGVTAVIAFVTTFLHKMSQFVKNALQKIGQGAVLCISLPIMLVYSVYTCAVSVCEKIGQAIKDGAKMLKDTFIKIKDVVASWIAGVITKAKDIISEAAKAIKDGAKKAVEAIGDAWVTVVSVVGQVASDVKDAIKDAYTSFIDSAKEFSESVKSYISNKWDQVKTWCKNTATAFSDGVKNVWNKMKEKVTAAVGAAKDAYNAIKDYAKETIDNINKWQDGKQRDFWKSGMKYAVNKWGKDEVSSWLDEL